MSAENTAATPKQTVGCSTMVEDHSPAVMVPELSSAEHSGSSTSITNLQRKRKGGVDDWSESPDVEMEDKEGREPHSQIEKRRRDKMNNLIDELSAMIPASNHLAQKHNKLTVLRMAVQHLKSLKAGNITSFKDSYFKPSFLPEEDLNHLVIRAAEGFLFVVSCERGKILFASESVSKILNFSRLELVGQSLFDYVHPKDMSKVKEQLSASELHPRERLINAKRFQVQTDVAVGATHLCTGERRSFFCRIKHNRVKTEEEKASLPDSSKRKESNRYCTVHCAGYMRRLPSSQLDTDNDVDEESSHLTCLVAVCRVHQQTSCQPTGELKVKPTEFVTRFAIDGKFTFVDQQATTIIGYLPQELLGTSCYEYVHQDDLQHLAERHRKVLRSKEKIGTNFYKFKTKHGSFVLLQSQWLSFINPWTKEVEFIVSTNRVVSTNNHSEVVSDQSGDPHSSHVFEETLPVPEILGISSATSSLIYAGSIGTQIANELIDSSRLNSSPSSGPTSPLCLSQTSSNLSNPEDTSAKAQSQSYLMAAAVSDNHLPTDTGEASSLDLESMVMPDLSNLNNDEAAMAVIMSLLETDASLGDAGDFDNMHWSF